ncbi:MAG TPA: hypothetical protein PKD79_02835 [Candidatus Doudnabacteria bacterium]|nr:hypothetical protein [Candidatus Doudnabacteria bacterium]
MNLENIKKIEQAIKPFTHIGIVIPERLGVDFFVSTIALAKKLQLIGKKATIFSSALNLPELLFFPNTPKVYQDFTTGPELVVRVNGSTTKPKQLRYEKDRDDLLIYLTPESGQFSEADIEVLPSATNIELLFILGSTNLKQLGKLYSKHTEVFYNIPKIVINNKLEQEYFGTINWVDGTASCLSEQLASWLLQDEKATKEDLVTTGLLAGIIDATQSFRDPKTTPDTLALAARLVNLGARRQDVIQYLFKTKPFNLIQLWGRALARVKTITEQNTIYTILTTQDFQKTNTNLHTALQVMQELIQTASHYQLIICLAEQANGVELFIAGRPHVKLLGIATRLDQTGDHQLEPLGNQYNLVRVVLPNKTVEQAEALILNFKLTGI